MFEPYVEFIAVAILMALFWLQARGTGRVGAMFGPLMLMWFCVLAVLGLWHVAQSPGVLVAINPLFAWDFFHANGWEGFLILGTVFLVVTGGEALYADIGHFGDLPDSRLVVRGRVSLVAAQLFRPGVATSARSVGRRAPALSHGA